MKILESYKKMAKSMLTEHAWDRKFGEPLPTLEDVMREAEDIMDKEIEWEDPDTKEKKKATVGGILKKGEKHPAYDDAKQLADKGGEEEPKGKGLGKGDFERDFDDEEPEDKPSGEPEGDEESKVEVPEDESEWAIEMKDGGPMEKEYRELKRDLKWADNDEEKAELEKRLEDVQNKYNAYVKKGVEKGWIDKDGYRRGVKVAFAGIPSEESISINGQKYRPIKDSVEPKKHLLREMYERIGGK